MGFQKRISEKLLFFFRFWRNEKELGENNEIEINHWLNTSRFLIRSYVCLL